MELTSLFGQRLDAVRVDGVPLIFLGTIFKDDKEWLMELKLESFRNRKRKPRWLREPLKLIRANSWLTRIRGTTYLFSDYLPGGYLKLDPEIAVSDEVTIAALGRLINKVQFKAFNSSYSSKWRNFALLQEWSTQRSINCLLVYVSGGLLQILMSPQVFCSNEFSLQLRSLPFTSHPQWAFWALIAWGDELKGRHRILATSWYGR